MEDKITTVAHSYGLPEDETSALTALIYAHKEGRVKPNAIAKFAESRLIDAIVCRGTGMADLSTRVERVLLHFRKFNKEQK